MTAEFVERDSFAVNFHELVAVRIIEQNIFIGGVAQEQRAGAAGKNIIAVCARDVVNFGVEVNAVGVVEVGDDRVAAVVIVNVRRVCAQDNVSVKGLVHEVAEESVAAGISVSSAGA